MSQLEKRLTDMLAPAVEALGFELLGCEFVRAGKHSTLRLYIDHENGIDVDDCAEVSHQVSAVLDVEDPISTEYNLEVSSPGMDRPLFKPSHYKNIVGEIVSIKTNMPQQGRRNFKGKLVNATEIDIEVEVDKQTFTLAYNNINKANLVADLT
ncbi:ribosome maturation factor RimP [Agaribacter flavus]|uniref:Ribosome maturation factor RimP n=1 Tax=Agaribacter flavus TaxID=1902781 RepID=A0ABV7FMH6_9ALTE